ncbi:S41 family peptidase [Corynebacterium sp. L4756]|uniref:S41 family peptidase n=1 Tax=unclassified Corynebacterium TaxID=2624378 RepID=UPI00374CFD0F
MVKKIVLSVSVLLLAAIAAAVYFLGPTVGAMYTGKPIFLGHDSPKRYGNSVLTMAETQGIHADSQEFARAKVEAQAAIESANTREELYEPLRKAVEAAGGKHSSLFTPEESAAQSEDIETDEQPTIKRQGGMVVATLPAVNRNADVQAYADTIAEGVQNATCAVVDLRGNTGGDMGPMVAGLSPLLPDGDAMFFHSPYTESAVTVDGTSVSGGGTALSVEAEKNTDIPIAVLVDEKTASSGEATMLAFKGLENAVSFGQPTAGFATANTVYDYPDGSYLMLTIAQDKDRNGQVYGDDPIAPDHQVDDAMASAQAWLSEHGCR